MADTATRKARPTGVRIEERPDMALLQLMARRGQTAELGKKLARFLGRRKALGPLEAAQNKGLLVCATGPEEYWVLAEGRAGASAMKSLQKIVGGTAYAFDHSAGRSVVRLSGEHAARVLAKGTALDLHPEAFPALRGTHTVIAHIPALVVRRERPACTDVCVPLSYAQSFAAWLREAARVFAAP